MSIKDDINDYRYEIDFGDNQMAKPEHTIKVGAIQLAIWSNETEKGVRQSISIVKNYKAGEEWKQTTSFSLSDLPKVSLAIQKAMEYIYVKDTDKTDF